MFCKKVSKSNETRTIDQVCRGRWKIFLDLERNSSFLCQKCFLLKWHRFYLLSELYHCNGKIYHFLFLSFHQNFYHGHWRFRGQQGKGAEHLYSYLLFPPTQEHSDISFKLCIWDDYHVLLIASHVITRLLLDKVEPPLGISVWLIFNCSIYLMN